MKLILRAASLALMLLPASPVPAADSPGFQVDPFWPKPLPNNWILGQVAGVAVDAQDHVWISSGRAPSPTMRRAPPSIRRAAAAACQRRR